MNFDDQLLIKKSRKISIPFWHEMLKQMIAKELFKTTLHIYMITDVTTPRNELPTAFGGRS